MKGSYRIRRAGFTLIEIMVAAGIFGMLSALAVNKYQLYVDNAKRSEAYNGLGHIKTGEAAYWIDNEVYTPSLVALDFQIDGGQINTPSEYIAPIYTYDLSQPWGALSYYAVATANLDGDPWPDVLVTWDLQQ